ncbi:MAG: TlpA family protein disulfide reductase [candidate division Zixibacteria bacterium]|nr:TlpA family protein disulfide reductase [candidate division Zixibacteria bacterium]
MAALEAGTRAPDFSLSDIKGVKHTLTELSRDGLLLTAFFKVSCGTCKFSAPYFEKFYQAYKERKGFQFWGVSQDTAEDTIAYLNEYNASFPNLLDETHWISADYGLTNVPTLFLIDREGKILHSCVGFSRSDFNAMSETVARFLGETPVVISPAGDGAPDLRPG